MIGVAASPTDLQIAGEFFELFKTPWEPAVPKKRYPVVLSTDGGLENVDSDLVLLYGSGRTAIDRAAGVPLREVSGPVDLEWAGSTFPVYGRLATFEGSLPLTVRTGAQAVDYRHEVGTRTVWRIGYDLFHEVRHLLTDGQPAQHASSPTLELHIALLRQVLLESGVPFVEIPPRPEGHDFICCLTHDVDFFGIRRHKFDRTLAGFVSRASVKTLADLVRGRRPLTHAVRNWMALLSLPFVFLRLAPDFWRPFDDYARVEDGSRSTFFLVPFKGRPGVAPDGTIEATRAVSYDVHEIQDEMGKAAARGSELAVHGLDSWRDAESGRSEMMQLTSITGRKTAGVRMHWLYMATDSPRRLEAAGFDYDSTWGYNNAVGYRAGTSQVFRLPDSAALMELPLSIMDSALFYSSRMNRSREDARQDCGHVVTNARRFGGTVVINWHDRSLAPERLWGDFYQELVAEVGKGDRAWFTTAGDAVDWFRWRRSIRFTAEPAGAVTVAAPSPGKQMPAGCMRIHRPNGSTSAPVVQELPFDGREPVTVNL